MNYKEGDIICYQVLIYPKPVYGKDYKSRTGFSKYPYGKVYEPIVAWRIKKIKAVD